MEAVLNSKERFELVSVLREMDPTAPREHRRSPRRKTLISLWMQRLGRNNARAITKVMLVNVSEVGVGFLGKAACVAGEKFVLPLPFNEGGGWLVLCEVRNCRKLASGHFKMGAKFLDRIEDKSGDAKIPGDWLGYAQ
jgi:hypothetical protein